jgi:pimeloyl-ACP methyl ester carboxylesterase
VGLLVGLPVVLSEGQVRVADGVRLAVRERSPRARTGRTVVLVHGLASTSRLWDGVAAELADAGVRSIAVDLRGHGESDAPDHGYDTATAAADVITLIGQVSDEPVVLAGQSWGGNVVVAVAATRPDLVSGLALVDGGWITLRSKFSSWQDALAALTPAEIDGLPAEHFEAMVASSLTGFPPGSVDAATSVVRVDGDGTIRRRLLVHRHLQILRSMWDESPERWYPRVAAPSVLMPATVGDEVDPDVATALRTLPSARLRAYPGAHHDIHLQRPREVADDIRSLL